MNLTRQQKESCARLYHDKDFLDVLKQRLEEHRSNAVMQRDDVPMRWAQGRAQELQELLKLIENSAKGI